MDERAEVVGFADYVAAGEHWAAAKLAKHNHAFIAITRRAGKLLVNGRRIRPLGLQIEHNDIRPVLLSQRQTRFRGFASSTCMPRRPSTVRNTSRLSAEGSTISTLG